MTRTLLLAAAAALVSATPAFAQAPADTTFTGPRVGVNLGIADDDIFGTESVTYGAEIGYDQELRGAVIGITGEIQDSDDITRELALTARAGARVGSKGLIYATAGYSNVRAYGFNFDGARIGVGGEFAINRNAFVKLEQRYGNYEAGVELYQTLIGFGVRF